MKLVVIGAFENAEKAPFPSHVPPILAERGSLGFRRVFYNAAMIPIEVPGEIKWKKKAEDMLNVISVIRIVPQPFRIGDQVIYLGNSKLLVGSNKLLLSLRLLPHVFSRRFLRAVITIMNIYS